MKVYVLSKRHQESGWRCDSCGSQAKRRAMATLLLRDSNSVMGEVRLCAPCLREAIRATELK
jgi:hypothetical protein